MNRKVSISFLGLGGYLPTKYFFPEEPTVKTYETPLVQLAIQEYLENRIGFGPNDMHLLLLTDKAKEANFLNARKPKGHDKAAHQGLKRELDDRGFRTRYQESRVSANHDRASSEETFKEIVKHIQKGDELYIDITHGFRSMPMLMIVLANFLRVTQNVIVKAIYYGAFEDAKQHGGRAPIYDLSYLVELQDWTTAANTYIKYGYIKPLSELSNTITSGLLAATQGKDQAARYIHSIVHQATHFSEQIRTNRLNELHEADAIDNIKHMVGKLKGDSQAEVGPIGELMAVIAKKGEKLTTKNNLNWLYSARLAFEDGLIQQTCSLLIEGVISHMCREHDVLPAGTKRTIIERALKAYNDSMHSRNLKDLSLEDQNVYNNVRNSSLTKQFVTTFRSLRPVRNDLMHAGQITETSNDARKSYKIISEIEKALREFEKIFLS